MVTGLHHGYGAGYLHFITSSCDQRLPLLGTPRNRNLFLEVLEQARRRYRFVVVGHVVMPEHIPRLVSELERAEPSLVMQVLEPGFARRVLCQHGRANHAGEGAIWELALQQPYIWQKRIAVWSAENRWEKLHYIHHNPVVNEALRTEMKVHPIA